MTAFSAGLDSLFSDANMGVDAVFTPGGGGPSVPARAVRVTERVDAGFTLGTTGASSPSIRYDVRKSEVEAAARGDSLHIGTDSYRVTKAEPDEENLLWRLYVERGS